MKHGYALITSDDINRQVSCWAGVHNNANASKATFAMSQAGKKARRMW